MNSGKILQQAGSDYSSYAEEIRAVMENSALVRISSNINAESTNTGKSSYEILVGNKINLNNNK